MQATTGCDYVVVGAGPGGCAVAGRLAQAGADVVLIEAGHSPLHPKFRVPLAAWHAMASARSRWTYRTAPVASLDGRKLALLAGRVVGGGAAINGMLFIRGGRADYDRWRDVAGCSGWGFDDVLPFLRRFEASSRGASPWHGGDGPVRTSPAAAQSELAQRFLAAARMVGLPIADDLNTVSGEAAGRLDFTLGQGVRSLPGAAYLGQRARPGRVRPATETRALRVDLAGTTAQGVTCLRKGAVWRVEARREVILAAGAIETPHLLQHSGVGPADLLLRHGVTPVLDWPDVGANLQNHLAYLLDYACPGALTLDRITQLRHAVPAALRYAARRDGPLADAACPVGALLQVDPSASGPDAQLILGAALPPDWGKTGFRLMANHGLPRSRGRVELRSGEPLDPPVLTAGWDNPEDMALLAATVRRAREIAQQPPLAEIITASLSPAATAEGDALAAALRAGAGSYYHTVGTCRMGADAAAVCDLRLRVNGIARLRIADNSAAPLQINGNTAACALMLGERAAAFALEEGQA